MPAMAMICPACGAKNLEGVDECKSCGTDLRTVDLPKPASEAEASVMHLPLTTLSMTQVHAIPPDATLDAAVQTLTRQKLDFLEIVDPGGKLLGVFSVRDVVTRVGPDYRGKLQQPVSDFMTRTVETLPPDAPITFALNRMDVGGYRHVPVVVGGGGGSRVQGGQHGGGGTDTAEKTGQSAGHILGIVSSRDVLAYLVKHSHEHVATHGVTTSHGVRP
jgi:CBS domain-containing protein